MPFTLQKSSDILNTNITKSHYIELFKGEPASNGTVASAYKINSDTGCKRMQMLGMGTASAGYLENKEIIFMGDVTKDVGTVTHFAFYKTEESTEHYYYGKLVEPKEILKDQVPLFRAGKIRIGLDIDEFPSNDSTTTTSE